MAAYSEIFDLNNNSALRNKVFVAGMVKAHAISALATPTAEQQAWARQMLSNPDTEGRKLYYAVLAANVDQTTAAILAASDAAIQTQVNAVVDKIFAV